MAEYNESQINSNETERIAQETERINNEARRNTNEIERQEREDIRQEYETTRREKEDDRIFNINVDGSNVIQVKSYDKVLFISSSFVEASWFAIFTAS